MASQRIPKAIQLVDTRLLIEEAGAFDAGYLGFVARMQAQAGLPYRDLGPDVHVYQRKNGRFVFRVVSHAGIPFGTLPRVLLAYASTEAVRTKSPYIELGKNVSTFLRKKLGMKVTGGEKGNIPRLKLQAYRLFSSQISLTKEYSTGTEGRLNERYMNISEGQDLSWWAPNAGTEETVWESQIKLSPQFFEEVTNSPVPVDWRAVSVLKSSPMALDLYFWLTYRMKYLKDSTSVPWFGENGLQSQFGSDADDDHKGRYGFKVNMEKALKQVLAVYSEARVVSTPKGLLLKPSPTHIVAMNNVPSETNSAGTAPVKPTPSQYAEQLNSQISELAAQRRLA